VGQNPTFYYVNVIVKYDFTLYTPMMQQARRQSGAHERRGADEDELLMRRRKSRGQAMVEFALLSGLLFLLVMGIFDFGRAIAVYINIAEAAHEGARQLVLRSNYSSTPPDSVIINARSPRSAAAAWC